MATATSAPIQQFWNGNHGRRRHSADCDILLDFVIHGELSVRRWPCEARGQASYRLESSQINPATNPSKSPLPMRPGKTVPRGGNAKTHRRVTHLTIHPLPVRVHPQFSPLRAGGHNNTFSKEADLPPA